MATRQHAKADLRAGILVCLAALALSGCGGPRDVLGKAAGKVTFRGQPVTEGVITFSDASQGISNRAKLDSTGGYTMFSADGAGMPVGTYKVTITPPEIEHPLGPIKEPPKPQHFPNLPEKYRDPATTDFTAAVKAGDNPAFDFDMK